MIGRSDICMVLLYSCFHSYLEPTDMDTSHMMDGVPISTTSQPVDRTVSTLDTNKLYTIIHCESDLRWLSC